MKLSPRTGSHVVDLLFTLALFCVFAASALLVVLIGAKVYKNTVEQMDASFSQRTSITYVTTKLRQNDAAGQLRLTQLDGTPALRLTQVLDGDPYETWIYHSDGVLRELFVAGGTQVALGDGQVIVEVPQFTMERDGDFLVLATVDQNGSTITQRIAPRCGIAGEGAAA